MPAEAATWAAHGPGQTDAVRSGHWRIATSGIGMECAERAAQRLLDEGATALLSWGVAGALVLPLGAGDLVLPERVASPDGCVDVDPGWHAWMLQQLAAAGVATHSGALWCSPCIVAVPARKHQLAQEHDVAIVDMESAAVARVAARAGVPFVAVKAVCDSVGQRFPDVLGRILRPDGSRSARGVAEAILEGPRTWHTLWQLRRHYRMACDALQRVAGVLATE